MTIGNKTAVKTPTNPIAKAAKAAAFSLISRERAMPIACEISPSVNPFAASCLIFRTLNTNVPKSAPKSPVRTTNPIANEGTAPMSCAVMSVMGAVTDFVVIESIVIFEASKSHKIPTALRIVNVPPAKSVTVIGRK